MPKTVFTLCLLLVVLVTAKKVSTTQTVYDIDFFRIKTLKSVKDTIVNRDTNPATNEDKFATLVTADALATIEIAITGYVFFTCVIERSIPEQFLRGRFFKILKTSSKVKFSTV